jgi:hypothetical protein
MLQSLWPQPKEWDQGTDLGLDVADLSLCPAGGGLLAQPGQLLGLIGVCCKLLDLVLTASAQKGGGSHHSGRQLDAILASTLAHEHVQRANLCSLGAQAPLMDVLSRKSFANVGLFTAVLQRALL